MTAEPGPIETERLTLRRLPPAAARLLPADRPGAARLIGAALAGDWPGPDLLDILPLLGAASGAAERFGAWVIVETASATVIGDLGFLGPPGPNGTIEIGYSVTPGYRRRGYATEAVRALVGWGLSQPDVAGIVAHCDPGNEPSIRVLELAGFARDGIEEGQLRWRKPAG